jgi:hypothetical protein
MRSAGPAMSTPRLALARLVAALQLRHRPSTRPISSRLAHEGLPSDRTFADHVDALADGIDLGDDTASVGDL